MYLMDGWMDRYKYLHKSLYIYKYIFIHFSRSIFLHPEGQFTQN